MMRVRNLAFFIGSFVSCFSLLSSQVLSSPYEDRTEAILQVFDQNRDGVITRDERSAVRNSRFHQLDGDQSGFLDRAEWMQGYRSSLDHLWVHPKNEIAREKHHVWMYRAIDLNQDGLIALDEFMSYDDGIEAFDLDHDGRISRDEISSVLRNNAERPRVCDHREEK
ncbi:MULTISPECIES: EF-hand domain-containing protein [unclassified Haematospirillum]|uniref:EF-hand domain-containing protein n=1 Tax=unclassified Haematospirillum TaxID=2622088 RepID=UPI00143AE698|nr:MULTISPECIES: EF-hand domain-containing protein [unclassified Haematospirillum]NKD54647.1 hypothetical protein [Haematospirillum sp. H4890]NKD74741.1 hypothetical protein [Haematospirillum sp. H4485]